MSRVFRKLKRGLLEAAEMYGVNRAKMPWYKAVWQAIYLSDAYDVLAEPYNKVYRLVKRCKMVLEFLPVVWQHNDWDYGYILTFNHYLHKRLYKGVYVEGHHVIRKQDKRALIAVIELYKRLHDEEINEPHWDRFYAKWKRRTDSDSFFSFKTKTDANGRTYTTLHDPVEDWATPEELKQYAKERKDLYAFDTYRTKQHMDLLLQYIKKYSAKWWD